MKMSDDKKVPSPNDQRSNNHNPNSPDFKDKMDHRANQLNYTHPAYYQSRGLAADQAKEAARQAAAAANSRAAQANSDQAKNKGSGSKNKK
jgi:hypothetical protein